jgi:hypothetical protein
MTSAELKSKLEAIFYANNPPMRTDECIEHLLALFTKGAKDARAAALEDAAKCCDSLKAGDVAWYRALEAGAFAIRALAKDSQP